MKIFIGYAREDQQTAVKLYQNLRDFGFEPWMDIKDLLPGQPWRNTIEKEIKNSTYFLALLSSKSLSKRGFFQKELKLAIEIFKEIPESDIYFIPIRIDECEPSNISIEKIHWVDLFPHYSKGLKNLLLALKVDLDDYQKIKIENEILKEEKELIKQKNCTLNNDQASDLLNLYLSAVEHEIAVKLVGFKNKLDSFIENKNFDAIEYEIYNRLRNILVNTRNKVKLFYLINGQRFNDFLERENPIEGPIIGQTKNEIYNYIIESVNDNSDLKLIKKSLKIENIIRKALDNSGNILRMKLDELYNKYT
jgi:hypothetical protein